MEELIKLIDSIKESNAIDNKEIIKDVINSAVNCANYISKSIHKTAEYTNKCSILIDMTLLNYHSLMENKDILFKNVDVADINKYYGAIHFLISMRNKYDFIPEHDSFIKEYYAYSKPLKDMSKEELLTYIKYHNIK